MASRELIKLKPGDVITTLHYGMTLSGPDTEPTEVEVDTFTIGANPQVKDENVGDGTYGYFFEFIDPLNNSALSNMVTYTIQNGQITTSVDNTMTPPVSRAASPRQATAPTRIYCRPTQAAEITEEIPAASPTSFPAATTATARLQEEAAASPIDWQGKKRKGK